MVHARTMMYTKMQNIKLLSYTLLLYLKYLQYR
nr:MAG TPA: hypothetical protein [Caudoviricetes sp.]